VKIKNQLTITVTVFVIILIVIIFSIFYMDQQARNLANDDAVTGNIATGISNLNHVSDFYFLYQQNVQLSDWQSNITALYNYVLQLNSTSSNQKQMSSTLWSDISAVDNAFSAVTNYLENTPYNMTVRTDPEFQFVWSHLSDELQAFSTDTSTLSQSLHSQTNTVNESSTVLIVILLAAFGAYLIVSYFIMFRRTLRTITKIDDSLKVIGSGDFDHQVSAERNDELGELSNAVNTMRIQLKAITTQLKEQERLAGIGQTAGMVGHDLRNPLQALVSEVYLIEEELKTLPDSESRENLKESAQTISDQISYMDKIVSDLQTFVKPVVSQKEPVNAKQLTSSVISLIEIPANVKLATAVPNSLVVNTDAQLLKRVLINLANNAIQAMPKGGNLTITAEKTGQGKIQLTVQDTGVGIPDSIKPKIFTPLFTTKSRGQGFGLAVCKRVIEAQGGTITFESQVGKGTKFVIELP
jgi:Signal transduction histidine kinase